MADQLGAVSATFAKKVRTHVALPGGVEGPVLYWMSREIRAHDNYALLYAAKRAHAARQALFVCYNLEVGYLGGGLRQHVFKTECLRSACKNLQDLGIQFFVYVVRSGEGGSWVETFAKDVVEANGVSLVVTDFTPLNLNKKWLAEMTKALSRRGVGLEEVDAHNVAACWEVSDKCEFGARTIRPKCHRHLEENMRDFQLQFCSEPRGKGSHLGLGAVLRDRAAQQRNRKFALARGGAPLVGKGGKGGKTKSFYLTQDFDHLASDAEILKNLESKSKPVSWIHGGEEQGNQVLHEFLTKRLIGYALSRNDPNKQQLSNLSPFFHYGALSPQRAINEVREVKKSKGKNGASGADCDAFVEEGYVRRELADNYCFYEKNYDNPAGFHAWSQKSHTKYAGNARDYLYTKAQWEQGKTHDPLWNAAQMELVEHGKMHGFMRMYWAKKLLEWTKNVGEAQKVGLWLNDLYSLDGRDPNGYVGVAWSVGGVHDRAWGARPVFGQIRYMNYAGCKVKFDIYKYIGQHLGTAKAAEAQAADKASKRVRSDGDAAGSAPPMKKTRKS